MRYIVCPHCGCIQAEEPKTFPGQPLMLLDKCDECGKVFAVTVNWAPDYDTERLGYLSDED